MKLYAQIIDEKSKLCTIGMGENTDFYKSIGMVEMEVEQAYNGNWYIKGYAPSQPLDELKAQKIDTFKSKRDTEEVNPIAYNGNFFDFDDKARDRINSAIIALSITGQSIEWTTADNANVSVTADDLRGVVANVAVRSNQLHAKYRELKEQVLACTTAEEVAEIVW